MSIANDKGTDITQLEFQSVGQASTSSTLIQPLLEHASTYNCHVMNLVTSMGNLPAVPSQELFRVIVNPFVTEYNAGSGGFVPPYQAFDPLHANFGGQPVPAGTIDVVQLENAWAGYRGQAAVDEFLDDVESGAYLAKDDGGYSYSLDDVTQVPPDYVVEGLCYKIKTPAVSSSIDFVWELQQQVNQVLAPLYLQLGTAAQNAGREWDSNDLIKICVNLKGNLNVKVKTELFKRGFMLIFSPFFRKLMGTDVEIMTMYHGLATFQAELITKMSDWPDYNTPAEFSLELLNARIPTDGPRQVLSFESSVFEQADFRKKLIMDVTFPIDATIVVKDEKPEVRHQLQEFELRPGMFEAKYGGFNKIVANNVRRCNVIQQEQFLGPRVLLDNSTSLAVKKLFEGQMQTIRIDLILEYTDWNGQTNEFVDKRVPLQFDQGMFNYMKFIFCKEVV